MQARFRLYDLTMTHPLTLVMLLFCGMLAGSPRAALAQDNPVADSPLSQTIKGQLFPGEDAPAVLPPLSSSSVDLWEIPSISGRYSVGGRTVMPYLGAGFSGGYTSELNRSLAGPPPAQTDVGLRGQLGAGFSPNEFQMGLRIPF